MIRLLRFLKPYRLTVAVVLILAFAQSMANLYLPKLMADIIDNGVIPKKTDYIWRTGGLMLLVTLGGTICAIIGAYYGARVATSFGKGIRASIFSHVTKFSLHEFDSVSTASLITRTTNDTTQVQQVMVMILLMLVTAPMMAIGGIILAVHENAKLSLVLLVAIPILVGAIILLMTLAIPLFQMVQF
jgi:ATP-binding cassette subfamily B protein